LFARYLLAIASLAFLYSLAQALRHAFRMRGGVDPISAPSGRLLDFVADQASGYCRLVLLTYMACYSRFCAISDSPVCIGDFDFSIWLGQANIAAQ
jgi:ABC-type branched-subunit amino acid transport system permease subunit